MTLGLEVKMQEKTKRWLDTYLIAHNWHDLFMLQYKALKQNNMQVVRTISEYARKEGK